MTENNQIVFDGLDLSNIPSMDELLGGIEAQAIKAGTLIPGTIVEKRSTRALIDIGCKAEGELSSEEFTNWPEVQVGDEIEILLKEIENDRHMPSISLKEAVFMKAWAKVKEDCGEGAIVKGTMKARVKGGITVDVMGIEAFLPGSQLDIGPVKNMDQFIGNEYDVKILKINEDRKNIVVSRRELLEDDRKSQRDGLLKDMEKGQIRKGVIKNITDFGAFIDLGGVDGLLHITDISWGRISHPSEKLTVGEEIDVMITDIDNEKGRVSLGLKQKSENPWDNIETRFPVGNVAKGRVVNIMPYGAFVGLEDGVEGLIHISEMSWTKRITKAGDVLSVGEEVEAVVLDIQKDSKKISLGLRQMASNPWDELAKKYPVGEKLKGEIRNMTSYGAFVKIDGDIDGMIHVSDMSWTRSINNPNEVLKEGEEVEAIVLDIDPSQQRISLGIKQLEGDPWAGIDKLYNVGDIIQGKIAKTTAFGAFVELSQNIDGLIHISQISKERVEKVKDVLSIGDDIEARIIKIDKDERRIGLSIKAAKEDYTPAKIKEAEEEYTAALKPGVAMVDMGSLLDNELSGLDEDILK